MLLLGAVGQDFKIVGRNGNRIEPVFVSSMIDDLIDFVDNLSGEKLYLVVNEKSAIFLEILYGSHSKGKVQIFPVSSWTLDRLVADEVKKENLDSYNVIDKVRLGYEICEKGFPRSIGGPRPFRLEDNLYGQYWWSRVLGLATDSFYELTKFHVGFLPFEPFVASRRSLGSLIASIGDVRWYMYKCGNLFKRFKRIFDWNSEKFLDAIFDPLNGFHTIYWNAQHAWYNASIAAQCFSNYRRFGVDFIRDADDVGFRLGDAFYRIYYQEQIKHPEHIALYRTTTAFVKFVLGVLHWAFENSERDNYRNDVSFEFLDVLLPTEEEREEYIKYLKLLTPDREEFEDAVVPCGQISEDKVQSMSVVFIIPTR